MHSVVVGKMSRWNGAWSTVPQVIFGIGLKLKKKSFQTERDYAKKDQQSKRLFHV